MRRRSVMLLVTLIVLSGVTFLVALMFGGSKLSVEETIQALLHPHASDAHQMIVWRIRLPRVLLAFVVGAGLAPCGACFQGVLRNPLADPFTLGVSGGAALGATLGIVSGVAGIWLPLCAFGGALVSVFLVYVVAGVKRFSTAALILGGVILSFVFSSMVMLVFAVSQAEKIHGAILWLMGDLSSAADGLIKVVGCIVFCGVALLVLFARELNVLSLGEEKAAHLGVRVELTKKLIFVIASLVTAACVSASGMIGFVGLVVPHFIRHFSGPDHRVLIPACVFGGASLLIACDCLARTIVSPMELPVGVVTGFLGGLFFLAIFFRSRNWELF
jgi:iron complex transport system permease protein